MTTVRKLLTTALLLSLCSVCVGAEGLTFGVAGSDASIADKPHGLPLIAITTNTALNAQKKVMAHMKTDGYDGPISIKLRGNSSLGFNQKKEDSLQKARLEIMRKFGKNAILKGTDLEEGATTIDRNSQIGGHKA